MEAFIQQIAQRVSADPVRTRWIIFPSRAVAHTVGERLAREGYAWARLRFTTVAELAWRIVGPSLMPKGVATRSGRGSRARP